MSAQTHHELERLFTHAIGLSIDERAEFLARDVTDAAMRARLERLLALDEEPADPISHAIGDAAVMATTPALPDAIGAYRPLRRLGAGGMGTVYLAERADGRYRGEVAIKVLSGHFGDNAISRLRRERELLARLDHPNIARLIDAGELAGGTPYVVMEFVDGSPIDTWCRDRHLPLDARIRLMIAAADAVQHAHRRLVVHRDLKPENVLVRADGVVKLLDFGIARMLSDEEAGTIINATIAYTPGYASPEQRNGAPVTVESDIYSLGVLLAEILVGERMPRGGDGSPTELRPSVVAGNRMERSRLVGDLDTIVLKATHEDPDRRYASAEAFADDLRRHLGNRPIRARPDSTWYRLVKQTQRHPFAMLFGVGLSLALVVAAVALKQQRDQALAAEQRAAASAESAIATAKFMSDLFTTADPTRRGQNLSALDLLRIGAMRIDTALPNDAAARARLKATIGTALMNLGDMQRGLVLAAGAVRDAPRDDPMERYERGEYMRLLAQLQWRTGDPAAAVKTVDAAIASFAPDDVPAPLSVQLGNTRVVSMGRLAIDDAYLRAAEDTAKLAERAMPSGHYLRGAANANLATAYEDLGRYGELIALRRAALKQFESDPSSMPGDRYLAQIAYARALRLNGDLDGARRLIEPAVRDLLAFYGGPHPNAAFALGELAAFQNEAGDATGALATARSALEMWTHNEYRGDVGGARYEEARALMTLGRAAEARTHRDELLHDDNLRVRRRAARLFGEAAP